MCGWILLSILLLLALLVQTIRITDMKGDIFRKKCRIELIERNEKHLADRLQAMTVSRDSYADLYMDACEKITALQKKVSRLQEEALVFDKAENAYAEAISQQNETLKKQSDLIRDLERNRAMEPAGHLRKSMTEMFRFIAVNQWLLESDHVFAEAVASVGEVAEAITERED